MTGPGSKDPTCPVPATRPPLPIRSTLSGSPCVSGVPIFSRRLGIQPESPRRHLQPPWKDRPSDVRPRLLPRTDAWPRPPSSRPETWRMRHLPQAPCPPQEALICTPASMARPQKIFSSPNLKLDSGRLKNYFRHCYYLYPSVFNSFPGHDPLVVRMAVQGHFRN